MRKRRSKEAVGCFSCKEKRSKTSFAPTWRRDGDSNPRSRFNGLHDFQSCSFDQLGQLSIRKHRSVISGALLLYRTNEKKSRGKSNIFYFIFRKFVLSNQKGSLPRSFGMLPFGGLLFLFHLRNFFIKTAREESTCSSLSSATIAKASCSVNTWKLVTIVRIGAV